MVSYPDFHPEKFAACILLCTLLLIPGMTAAAQFSLPAAGGNMIGALQETRSHDRDTLSDIARRYDLGFEQILAANPGVDAWLPGEGTRILLPARYILPDAPHRGIVVNLAEMRLYYFPPRSGEGGRDVYTYPVSIGRRDWGTPVIHTRIVRKVMAPAWFPPLSIRLEHAADGNPLPAVVPAGPGNPLGNMALMLAKPGYLIHGTNRPYGIGLRVSHGCIRMYPEDIRELFRMVRNGTPVSIVHQPIKAGAQAGTVYLEAHAPLQEWKGNHISWSGILLTAARSLGHAHIDWHRAEAVVRHRRGIPLPVAGKDGP